MISFSIWRSEKQERSLEFDCRNCIELDKVKRSVCFLKKRKVLCKVPLFNASGNITDVIVREMTKEDVVEHLIAVHKMVPSMLVTDVMSHMLMKIGLNGEKVCPMSLFNEEADWLVSLETAASKYHVLPYEGAYLDQPLFIIDAFDASRSAEARYNNYKMSKMTETKGQKQANKVGR